jgi:hypothetical protein
METESEYLSLTSDQSPILELVIRSHLYVENHLRKLLSEKLLKPDLIIRQGAPNFSLLINLCEATGATDGQLSGACRTLNALRNKYAHRLSYEALEKEADNFIGELRSIDNFPWQSYVPGSEFELGLAVNALGTFFEIKFGKLGFNDEKRFQWCADDDDNEDQA